MVIGRPDLPDFVAFHEAQTGGINVGQFAAAQTVQHPPDLSVMGHVGVKDRQTVQVVDEPEKRASRLFAVSMQKPRVGFRNDKVGSSPPWPGEAEQNFRLFMPLIAHVQ